LDKKYPQKNESKIEFIKSETLETIKYEELEGDLEIKGYSNLEKILLNSAKKISKISIENCPNIKVIIVNDNQITEIKGLDGLTNLQKLNFGDNKVEKINISENIQLGSLIFYGNPKNLQFIDGIKSLDKLISLNSTSTFPIITLLEKASEDDLKEVAGKLKLPVGDKSKNDLKKEIIAEIEKNNRNKEKITELSKDLFDKEGKVDEGELEKLTSLLKELERLHDVANHKDNAEILDAGHFSQTKLDEILKL
jgi:Leucine-rich repeat (LRR) protein